MQYKIQELPFFYQTNLSSDNGGFPSIFPFELYYDVELTLFRQKPTQELNILLEKVYLKGSLADGSISNESGDVYLSKTIDYILSNADIQPSSKILEIGFGSGIILKKLKELNFSNLTGLEPGNHTKVSGLENINLINDFFPSAEITQSFDLIYSLLVLEHIENPLQFLTQLTNNLNENGKIIFAVPNCEPYLGVGDLSIFIHEHFSYFTQQSIFTLVEKACLNIEDISIIEGAFFVTVSKNKIKKSMFNGNELVDSSQFYNEIEIQTQKLVNLFKNYKNEDIAIYAPIRALNNLFLLNLSNFRLVDDNTEIHGKYLPTQNNKIESFEEIILNPPKCILIFSRTFGNRIKQKISKEEKLQATLVLTLNDLDNEFY